MWSKICRITNFVLMVLAGLFLFGMTIYTFCNMDTVLNDIIGARIISSNLNAAGVLYFVSAYYWQCGNVSRLKGEIKDKTLMW
jgi:hypothetical protein